MTNDPNFTGLVEATPEEREAVDAMLPVCNDFTLSDIDGWEKLLTPENDPETWGLKKERQRMNDCQANSLTSGIEVVEWRTKKQRGELSRMFAYQQCEAVSGWIGRNQGTTIQSGVKVSQEIGCPLESEYPYNLYTANSAQFKQWCTPAVMASAATRKIVKAAKAPEWKVMIAHVVLGHPLHFGINWPVRWDSQRIVRKYIGAHGGGGHAVEGVYVHKLASGELLLKVLNSHGDGYFYVDKIAYEEMRRTSPYGLYLMYGADDPVKAYYEGQFSIMGATKPKE